jgi:hypothetical protein
MRLMLQRLARGDFARSSAAAYLREMLQLPFRDIASHGR